MDHKECAISVYARQRKKHGAGNVHSLSFGSERSQTKRFAAFGDIFDFSNASIVDVGCGHGDFYLWLQDQGVTPANYYGVDLIPEHIDIARERLPKECTLVCGDFLEMDVPKCDIAVLSGALSHDFDNWLEICHGVLNKMWDLTSVGMAFNMESPFGFTEERLKELEKYRTLAPEYWINYAFSITKKMVFLHDYLPADYTIGMLHGDFA